MKWPTVPMKAASVIRTTLLEENRQTHEELADELVSRGYKPSGFHRAIREIRDTFGADALVKRREGKRIEYVLNPTLLEGKLDMNEQCRRVMSETGHIQHVLDWLASEYGNRGAVRSSRRLAKELGAVLAELVDELA